MRLQLTSCVLFAILSVTLGARLNKRSLTEIAEEQLKKSSAADSASAGGKKAGGGNILANANKFTQWSNKELGTVGQQVEKHWDDKAGEGKVIEETGARAKVIGNNAAKKVEKQNVKDVDSALGYAEGENDKADQYFVGDGSSSSMAGRKNSGSDGSSSGGSSGSSDGGDGGNDGGDGGNDGGNNGGSDGGAGGDEFGGNGGDGSGDNGDDDGSGSGKKANIQGRFMHGRPGGRNGGDGDEGGDGGAEGGDGGSDGAASEAGEGRSLT